MLHRILKKFREIEGGYVFVFSLSTKIFRFVTSLLLIRILSPDDYGALAYVLAALSFFIPFSGAGLQHSFLRYAPMMKKEEEKHALFQFTLSRGLLFSFFIALGLIILIPWLNSSIENTSMYFYVLIFYLFGFFFLELIKNWYRVLHQNRSFAVIDIYESVFILVLGIGAAYLYGTLAYLIVFVSAPLFVAFMNLKLIRSIKITVPDKYYSYGIWVGIGAVASQLMYSLDVFLVGAILQDSKQVALYRSASIIPIALFFIPNSYISAHYAYLAKNSFNKEYLIRFVKDYLILFLILGSSLGGLLYFMSDYIILILFGLQYQEAASLFRIIVLGMIGAFIFRIPFGNLLASVGKSNWNAYVAFIVLFLNGVLNYFAIYRWGVMGAAIVTSLLFWISGLISMVLFFFYFKKI